MKAELDKKLCEKYSKIFNQRNLPMDQTCMCWGFDCDDGWYWLIDNLCESIQNFVDASNKSISFRKKAGISIVGEEEWQVEAVQVKEKFGGLRFYVCGGVDDHIFGMINLAESMSYNICEQCGSIKNVSQTKGGWIKTLCSKCMERREQ